MEEVGGGGYSQAYATGMYHPHKGRREGKTKEKLRNMVLCCHICKHYNLG